MGDSRQYDAWAQQIAGGEWVGTRGLLPGTALSVLARRRLQPARPRPRPGAPHPGGSRRRILRPAGPGRPPVLLGPGGRDRRAAAGRLSSGVLLRRADPEIIARHLPDHADARAARGVRRAARLEVAGRAGPGRRRPSCSTARTPGSCFPVVGAWLWFGFRDVAGAPPRRVDRGVRRRLAGRAAAGRLQELPGRRRVPGVDVPARTELLHREQPARVRHLRIARAGARRPALRTRRRHAPRVGSRRPRALARRGVGLLARPVVRLHPKPAVSLAGPDGEEGAAHGQRRRIARHRVDRSVRRTTHGSCGDCSG